MLGQTLLPLSHRPRQCSASSCESSKRTPFPSPSLASSPPPPPPRKRTPPPSSQPSVAMAFPTISPNPSSPTSPVSSPSIPTTTSAPSSPSSAPRASPAPSSPRSSSKTLSSSIGASIDASPPSTSSSPCSPPRRPFSASLTPIFLANINILKDHGLSEAMITKLLFYQPRSLTCTPAHFVDALAYLKKINVSPTSTAFVVAVGMLSYMSRSTFQRKLELYKELGWTEEQVLTLFKRQPTTLAASDRAIRKKVMYYRDTLGWDPEFFCKYSWIMTMSMEKRIIPRCAVLNVLMSNGLLKKNTWWASKFTLKEEAFEENFVKKYEKSVPEVATAYKGKIKFSGWDWMKDTKNQLEASKS